MKKILVASLVLLFVASAARAGDQNNNNNNNCAGPCQNGPSAQSQSNAYGVNYSSMTQIGVNNVGGVVQNSTVDGPVNDMGSASFQKNANVNLDSQAFTVGSIVNSSNSSINSTNSNNPTINNQSKATSTIIAPLY